MYYLTSVFLAQTLFQKYEINLKTFLSWLQCSINDLLVNKLMVYQQKLHRMPFTLQKKAKGPYYEPKISWLDDY